MTEPDERALAPERVAELAEALAGALNIAMPMRRIFSDEIGDAVEVLLAQEVEHAAYVLKPLVAGWLAEAEESRRTAWAVQSEHVDRMNVLRLHDMSVADERIREARKQGADEVRARVERLADEWARAKQPDFRNASRILTHALAEPGDQSGEAK